MARDPLTPLRLAKMVAEVEVASGAVVMLKLGETVAPPGTVTVAGTEAKDGLELVRLNTSPFAGAGLVRVRLSWPTVPAGMVGRFAVKATPIGLTVRRAAPADPFTLAVMVTDTFVDTEAVVTVKAEETEVPAATVTVAARKQSRDWNSRE